MDDDTLLRQLHTDLIAIQAVALAGGPDLNRAVPTCPAWNVADLLGHLWTIHTWVRDVLRTREPAAEQEPAADPVLAVANFIDGIPDYLTAMRAITADEPCWHFGPPPRLAGFWIRRQAHEHAVHRFDLETALGGQPPHFAPPLAADGVDEIVSMFYPRQVRLGRTEAVSAPIRLRANDIDGEWTLGDGTPVATVESDAHTLYLGLWKRIDLLAHADVDGDRTAVANTLALALTP